MILFLRKRLVIVFTSIIVALNILSMAVLLVYLHTGSKEVCKKHLLENISYQYIPNYRQGGLDKITRTYDEYYLQVIDRQGKVIGHTQNIRHITLEPNISLVRHALSGKTVFEEAQNGPFRYLVSYFPLDQNTAGQIAMSIDPMIAYENNFIKLVLYSIPGMLILSYLTSRVLVVYALRPAVDFCKFQENFLSNIAHELRSPLTSLQGNLEVSLRKDRTASEYKETLQIGLHETHRIIDLLNNLGLLASSRLKALDMESSQIDLDGILAGVIDFYTPQIKSKAIEVDMGEIAGITCLCDESLIKRSIENLIDNAVKYTPEKGKIEITFSKDQANIYLTIANTAKDVHEDEFKDLLEPFYRGKSIPSADIEGKGLGLYIAAYIVRSHNGDIKVALTPDKMFAVTISLPVK